MNIIKKIKPKPSIVFDTYWKFAKLRQDVFFNRINKKSSPWTQDPVLEKHKFTNAYRASDRVSQYLIKNVIYKGDQSPKEILFRLLLFKTFNKIKTWEGLKNNLGEITFSDFNFKNYSKIISNISEGGNAIYSGAYIMTSGKSSFGHERKFQNHLELIKKMFDDEIDKKIESAKSLKDLFHILLGYPTIGNFLAYQYAIDINYSEIVNFSEMDYVMPGPGAKDGIKKCFINSNDYSESDIIKLMVDNQHDEFARLGLKFKTLWGRDLTLIDCQNLFCEVDKYSRVIHPNVMGISNRKRIKQIFKPNQEQIDYWFPPKWNINNKIATNG